MRYKVELKLKCKMNQHQFAMIEDQQHRLKYSNFKMEVLEGSIACWQWYGMASLPPS